jgi:hypothetical protein
MATNCPGQGEHVFVSLDESAFHPSPSLQVCELCEEIQPRDVDPQRGNRPLNLAQETK